MGHSYTGRAHASTLNSLWAAPTVSTPQGQSCQWAWTGLNPAYWLVAVSATAGGLALTANLTPGGVRNSGQVANVGQWLQVTGLDASLVAITNTSLAIQATQWTAPTVSSPTTNTIVWSTSAANPDTVLITYAATPGGATLLQQSEPVASGNFTQLGSAGLYAAVQLYDASSNIISPLSAWVQIHA